jgi:hypothetical protein
MMSAPGYVWLEPGRGDLDEGLRARVADPVWFLTRQWQLGELQGEDASSPTFVTVTAEHRTLACDPARPDADPTRVPAEALVEAGPDDWWTIGRRVRLGRAAGPLLGPEVVAPEVLDRCRFGELPVPYDGLAGEVDGHAVFTAELLPGHALWAEVPATAPDGWSSRTLDHSAAFTAGDVGLLVDGHAGGDVDWFSVDGHRSADVPEEPAGRDGEGPAGTRQRREVIPGRMLWPGAPHPRWWQLEDRAVDIGGFAPDRSHLGTALLIDLAPAHAEDWFILPVPPPESDASGDRVPTRPSSGVLVRLQSVTVHDSFGEEWVVTPPAVDGARGWSLFRTAGLPSTDLVIWPTAVAPHAGPVLDDVLLGVDEDANLAWAVELRADGRQLLEDAEVLDAVQQPTATGADAYRYLPSTGLPSHWHPYEQASGGDWRQAVLANPAGPGTPRAAPVSRLLAGDRLPSGASEVHRIARHALPSSGIRLQRRAMLARDVDGRPVLWVERRTGPLTAPPASLLRFDVLAPDASEKP